MSDKVDLVAKAIYLSPIGGHEDPYAPRWDELRENQKEGFRENARAAIEAMSDDLEFKIAKLDLGPRDILVVKSDTHFALEQVAYLRRMFEEDAKISNKIMIIGPELDLAVLTRSEIEEHAA